MKFKRAHQYLNELPNAVSLAGVMFLFLYYLLTNSALLLTEGTPVVHLPKGSGARPIGFTHSVVVAMDHDAQLFFRNQQIDRETLKKKLMELANQADENGLLLVLQAHRGVQNGEVTRFAALAEVAGVRQIWLATRPGLFE
jgi:biopolymer transport protein ExbD